MCAGKRTQNTNSLCSSTLHLICFSSNKSHKLFRAHTCPVQYGAIITCKQSTCLRWAKHGADVEQGKFQNAHVQHTRPLNTADLRYPNTGSFKTSNLSHTGPSYQHTSKSKCLISCFSKGKASDVVSHIVWRWCFVSDATTLNYKV